MNPLHTESAVKSRYAAGARVFEQQLCCAVQYRPELLKIIPAFRDSPGLLLICATNFIRALDDAFLRHGRFDYVIPIGLPDAAAALGAVGRRRRRTISASTPRPPPSISQGPYQSSQVRALTGGL